MPNSVASILNILRWSVSGAAALVGAWNMDRESMAWAALTVALFGGPLVMQWMGRRARSLGAWLAVFMIGQAALSDIMHPHEFITLPPGLRTVVDVESGIPGVSGPQTITTDRLGFRVTRPIDYGHKAGFRIFAIGGSTTAQMYLDDHRTWTHLLQKGLSSTWRAPIEVVNTGVSGLSAVQHLATLKRIARYQPDLVVILVGFNDWTSHVLDAMWREDHPDEPVAPPVEFNPLLLRHSLLGNALQELRHGAGRPSTSSQGIDRGEYFTLRRNTLGRLPHRSFHPEAVDATYAKTLEEIGEECRRRGVRCMFVTQPTGYQPAASDEMRASFWMTPADLDYTLDFESLVAVASLYNRHLTAFAAAQAQLLCDAASQLEPTLDNFYDDCHFNVGGAERFAKILQACIVADAIQIRPGDR